MTSPAPNTPINADAFWMPFTANRRYKRDPVLFSAAEGMHYIRPDGRRVLDGIAGLWCVNAGHRRPEIVEAIARTAYELDYAPSFQMSHPLAFELAEKLCEEAPVGFSNVFFSNSGSEAVDTALKIALGYHRARGEGQRVRLIGRERSYHGVGFGGLSVSGIGGHRKPFGNLLPYVDHLPHTYDRERMAYTRGQPDWGAHLADVLERIVALHDASTIAAVIVEPMAGSTGVLIPPKGYLEKLREITSKHGILLIFDEVITAYGRLGAATASEFFGVTPDLIAMAKGVSNAAVPAGAVAVRREVHDAIVNGPAGGIEFFHGYTYSAHPLAAAAILATLDIYRREDLFGRARKLSGAFEQAAHSLKGAPHVIDVRNLGLVAGVELAPRAGAPGARAAEVFQKCFDSGLMVRYTGDIIAVSPPLIIDEAQIGQIFEQIGKVLKEIA